MRKKRDAASFVQVKKTQKGPRKHPDRYTYCRQKLTKHPKDINNSQSATHARAEKTESSSAATTMQKHLTSISNWSHQVPAFSNHSKKRIVHEKQKKKKKQRAVKKQRRERRKRGKKIRREKKERGEGKGETR